MLVLCVVPNIWLKIFGMFNLPMQDCSFLCSYLASLEKGFLSWSILLIWDMLALGWFGVVQCWNIVLVDEVFCSLNLLSKHLLVSPM